MLPFSLAPPHVSFAIGLVGVLPSTRGSAARSHLRNAVSSDLSVYVPLQLSIEMSGLVDDERGDTLTDLAADEEPVGFRQLEPQSSRHAELPRRLKPGHLASQTNLVGNSSSDLVGMHIGGQLRRGLRLGESDRLGRLQRRSRRLHLLQPSNPIDSHCIGHCPAVMSAVADALSQAGEHAIQPIGLRVDKIRYQLRCQRDCHSSNTMDQH
jgi:hypothetical protein